MKTWEDGEEEKDEEEECDSEKYSIATQYLACTKFNINIFLHYMPTKKENIEAIKSPWYLR